MQRGMTVDEIAYLVLTRSAWCELWRQDDLWPTLSARQQALVEAAERSLIWYGRIVHKERTRQRLGLRGTWGR